MITCRLARPRHTCRADADDEDAIIMRLILQERPRSVFTLILAPISDIRYADNVDWILSDALGKHGSQTCGASYMTSHCSSRLFSEGEIYTHDIAIPTLRSFHPDCPHFVEATEIYVSTLNHYL